MATLLQRFVDADQWEAEDDAVARLGMLMHAAFLAAGFHPYGAEPASGHHLLKRAGEDAGSRCLSRRYTAPPLARRDGADAAVLMLCAQGGGDVALVAFLTTERDLRGVYRERLRMDIVAPLLSRRALRDVEPWGSRICWRLAGGVCWGLLAELCRRNGLPTTGFMSLPDDVKVEILKRLGGGEDLARVESTCTHMRRLVAECDGELWKPVYKALAAQQRLRRGRWRRWGHLMHGSLFLSSDDDEEEVLSWKRRYVRDRPGTRWYWPWPTFSYSAFSVDEYLLYLDAWRERDPPEEEETADSATRGKGAGVRRRREVARKDESFKMKRHGSGAIHAPSARYRWKHR